MANLTSNLKTFGSTGTEYPDGYSYLEGEQPVDDWDNYVVYHTIEEIHNLQDVVNDRLESGQGTSLPGNSENGELFYDSDNGELFYDNNGSWERLIKASGDTMDGSLYFDGSGILSSGELPIFSDTDVQGSVSVSDELSVKDAALRNAWYDKFEGGTVADGAFVPMRTIELGPGERISFYEASLTANGIDEPAPSGVELRIVDSSGSGTSILTGDGATLYAQETGEPLDFYENSGSSTITLAVGLDNGYHGTGAGGDETLFGGFIAKKS